MKNTVIALASVLAIGAALGIFLVVPSSEAQTPSASPTQTVVVAADAFLGTLSAELRAKVQFPFTPQRNATKATFARTGVQTGVPGGSGDRGGRNDSGRQGDPARQGGDPGRQGSGTGRQGERGGRGGGGFAGFVGEQYGDAVWSNFPVSDVPRPGITIGDLSAEQRNALMHLLQVVLSTNGYQKVLDIMGSDQALSDGGTNYSSGTAFYTVGIFGRPSATTPWMLQFGGHHLGLNIVFVQANGVMTPTLTGAQPAVYTANGKTVRVLAQENDKAFALMAALDDQQRQQAILNFQVADLVLGPGEDGRTIAPEGLSAAAMTEAQRALLVDLISQWSGIVNDRFAAPRLAELKTGLQQTYFAWSGPTTHEPNRNGTSYYRIQGPKLFIEFSPQGVGGDSSNHVHTIYRDPTNDYARALLNK